MIDVVHPSVRATAASILSLMQNLFGLAGGPLLTGVLSDRYGLQFALAVVPAFCLARRDPASRSPRARTSPISDKPGKRERRRQRRLAPQPA